MKINSIDKTNFNGNFCNNTIFERVLENSSEHDLNDFLDVLKRMQKKDDGRIYSLRVVSNPLIGGDFLALFENEIRRGSRMIQNWDDKTKKIWSSTLKIINVILNNDYPPMLEEKFPPKEKLLKEIHEKINA